MDMKKVIGWVMKLPLILLILSTVGVGFYAALGYVDGFRISYAAPISLLIIIILYIGGSILTSSKNNKTEIESESNYVVEDEEAREGLSRYQID